MQNDLPKGFRAGAAAANFKKAGRDDLGLIVSDTPAVLAGMFTQNLFKAAPVLVCQEILNRGGTVRAVLANSGQANACTGDEGLANCRVTQNMVSGLTGLAVDEILPLSTGVVGAHLKMDRWLDAVLALVKSIGTRDAEGFTRSFMTTDA
ncbi:MAG: bifunctional ornithine acetyltransferase/N-acetylglutamate synthase, partial [Desulfovibrio sp.]|nr:bifunctional ornithine acetyltransferase/N-acetylglutamate synthase [Desulfovibrio sp.]